MDYAELAAQYAQQYGLDPELFVRQMVQESGLNPDAVSPKGASGIAQIMPDTARDPGFGVRPIEDTTDPEESLRFGAEYMRALLDKYGGDYGLALAAYNAGPKTVDDAGGIPPIRETQNYVASILGGKMQASAPGGFSTGAPQASLPGEELMFGIQEDPERQAILDSLMSRFRPADQEEQAASLARLMQVNAAGPGVIPETGESNSFGLESLPQARSVMTAVERMRGTP